MSTINGSLISSPGEKREMHPWKLWNSRFHTAKGREKWLPELPCDLRRGADFYPGSDWDR